jgi:hypothetical protein
MSRPHVEFIFAQTLPWERSSLLPGRAGTECKLLSRDEELGEFSAIVRFGEAWSASVTCEHQEELYVLDGDLSIGGKALRRDGYFRVPKGVPHRWVSRSGATVLVLLNVATPRDSMELVAIDAPQMLWDRSGVPPELEFMGIARKALFVDEDSGLHRTWLLSVAPQIEPSGALLAIETHTCAEEMFMLAGDITGPHGEMTPGAYFWRPQDTFHGPFGSRNGGLALARFRHGPQSTIFHDKTRPFAFEAPYSPALPAQSAAHAAARPPVATRY